MISYITKWCKFTQWTSFTPDKDQQDVERLKRDLSGLFLIHPEPTTIKTNYPSTPRYVTQSFRSTDFSVIFNCTHCYQSLDYSNKTDDCRQRLTSEFYISYLTYILHILCAYISLTFVYFVSHDFVSHLHNSSRFSRTSVTLTVSKNT